MYRNVYPFLTAAAMVAMLASCSSDSGPEATISVANRISFGATSDFTRSGDYTTNNLKQFYVYAYTNTTPNPTLFMDNVEVNKTATNVWSYSPIAYWPAKLTVDFYAYAPAGFLGKSNPLNPIEYDAYMADEDIIYAVAPRLSGFTDASNPQVIFNFRHALSKVTVKLRSSNTNLEVRVTNVALAHIYTKGNFHFPAESTSGTLSADNIGTWTDQNTPVPYILHMSQTPSDIITLTPTSNDMSTTGMGLGGDKYVLPQTLSYETNGTGTDQYITVMCSIYDADTSIKLWPNANTPAENIVEGSTFGDGLLKFPLKTNTVTAWQPGFHYIYDLTINSNDEMGTIQFGVPTVDAFVDVTTTYE